MQGQKRGFYKILPKIFKKTDFLLHKSQNRTILVLEETVIDKGL